MENMIILGGAIVALLVGYVYKQFLNKNQIEDKLKEGFGIKPEDKNCDFEEIQLLWKELYEENDEGNIDDITWNDLNMDDIFRRINACNSSLGEQCLYRKLRNIKFDKGKLNDFEEKVQFFNDNESDRIDVQKSLVKLGKRESNYYITSFLNNVEGFLVPKIWIFYLLQIVLFLAIGSVFVFHNIYVYAVAAVSFLVNLNVYALMKSKYEINMDLISAIGSVLHIGSKFSSYDTLHIFNEFKNYDKVIHKLSRSMLFINGRYQKRYIADFMEIGALYLTGAFLFDFVFYNRALKQIQKNIRHIFELMLLIGEIDTAISVASFRQSIERYCLPEFHDKAEISYKELYNPLLDDPICNDFCLQSGCIITGSNASGKSTFIKAIAINEILALSIHTCTAKAAEIPAGEIYSSMAIRDDLLAGESYFVREVKSLRRIIRAISSKQLVIAFIDEILKGTNTQERVAASAAILKYLDNKDCMAIVASHDLELIDLLKDTHYENFYFCEEPRDGKLIFDYKIHRGVCKKKNAIRLLESFSFPTEIVEEAKKYLGFLLLP